MKTSLPFYFILFFPLFSLSACFENAKMANIRVVHGSPDAPAVDVFIDDELSLSEVSYLDATGYLQLEPGLRNFKVNAAGTEINVIDASAELKRGKFYTLIAANLLESIEPLVLFDERRFPRKGNILLRIVHGAPSAPEVDVYVTEPETNLDEAIPVLESVPFLTASDYLEVPAGTYQVRVTVAGTKTVAVDTGSISLKAGQVRTAIAVDSKGGGSPFDALILADRG